MIDHLNAWSVQRCKDLVDSASRFRIKPLRGGCLLDFGVNCHGGLQAGIALAEICMGGLGQVTIQAGENSRPYVQVTTDQPAIACMASQYGGWPVKCGKYFAIGSGPFRVQRGKEPVLEHYGFRCQNPAVVGVLESAQLPDEHVQAYIAEECGLPISQITLCVAATRSLAGTIQIVARSVEATMHKLFELGVDLHKITSAMGAAPLPPVSGNDLIAIGRTNDAILYGGRVTLWVDLSDDEIDSIGPKSPSNSSADYGKPFGDIFRESGGDFYKLDPMLFSAAEIRFISNQSGRPQVFGQLDERIIDKSFS